MAVNFSVQFRINEKTQSRVLRLTDTSTGFTFGKGNFSVTFSDGSTRIKTDFSTPDISASGGYVDITLVTDSTGAVITGSYKVDYVALDTSLAGYSLSRTFDFNWVKPTKNIVDGSDVLLPEVKFYDNTSYTPSGSFTGVLTRTFTTVMPSNTPQSGTTVTGVGNLINPVFSGNYYEGIYTARADVSVAYTHTTNSWLTVLYIDLLQQVIDVQRAPTQYQLIGYINTYHAAIEAYETTNDTQFDILNEEYDLVMALYSHLIARYESATLDGSEPILAQLLDILRPYNVHSYTSAPLAAFSLETKSFNISDGTNTDLVPLNSTLNILGSNGIVTAVTNNTVTTSPTYGTTSGTIAQGNDARFHDAVTIGTANGLSLSTQILSLSSATTSAAGAMSAADKTKLDGIAAGAQTGTVTSVGVSMPAAFTVSNSPVTTSGTIAITATGTTLQYIRGNGTTATLNTTVVTEGDNLYFTNLRARQAISLTTTGTSGAATYDSSTGVLNIPAYQGGVTSFNTRTGAITLTSGDVTTALGFTPESTLNKGVAGGYASLDGSGLVPSTQLPSYVDDVLEYADLASFPASGTTGKIYVALDNNKIYRWSGSAYIEISPTVGTIWGGITGTLANQTDLQSALNAKQNTLTLTTTGTSGAATLVGSTLNIPEYQGGVTSFNTRTGAITLSSGDVTTALGFTPYNATNPSAYIALTALSSTATGLTYTNTTGVFSFTTGYSIPTNVKQSNWDDAYTWVAAFPTQTSNAGKYLTTDGSVLSWATVAAGVTSFNTRTGAITLTSSDVTTALGYTPVTNARTLTINGTTYDLTANRSWTVSGTLPAGGTAGQILSKINGTDYNTQWIDNFATQVKHEVKLGATIAKGKAVYVSTSDGTNMIVSAASNASEATSSKVLGLLETGGVTNDIVKVVTEGLLAGLDTSTATAGDPVWLGTGGDLIFGLANKPVAPAHLVFIGIVTRVQSNNGEIFVNVQNGFELNEIHDVLVGSYGTKDVLYRDTATNLWKNGSIASILGYTPYDAANPSNYIALTALSSTATGLTYTNTTGVFSLTSGYVIPTTSSATNWDTAYTNRITTLTTTGSSGAATLTSNTLNIPTYTLAGLGGVPTTRTITINGTTYDLSADRTYTITPSASARVEQNFTATAGQTTFTITGGYVVGLVDVFINGARLLPTDYTATNGTTVVLGTGALLNDAVTVLNYTSTIAALPTSRDVFDYTATAAQTTFTVSGGYTVGLLDVYVNGTKLTSSEVTATNGTTFVLAEASTVGNQVQAIRYNASITGISGSGTANYVPKFTATGTVGNSSIFDNGNVGINSSTSAGKLSVYLDSSTVSATSISSWDGTTVLFGGTGATSNALSLSFNTSTNTSYILSAQPTVSWRSMWFGASDYKFTVNQGATPAVTITSAGNVGIGTSSPEAYTNYNTLTIDGTSGSILAMRTNGTLNYRVGTNSGEAYLLTAGALPLVFYTNTTERMRITSDGKLLVGITAASGRITLAYDQSVNNQFLNIVGTQTSYNQEWGFGIPSNSRDFRLYDYTNGTERMRILANGDVKLNTSGMFYSNNSTIAVAPGGTTIFTPPLASGMYIVTYVIGGNPSNVGYAIVGNRYGSTLYVLASSAGSQTALSVSGLNLVLSQSASGSSLNTSVSYIILNSGAGV